MLSVFCHNCGSHIDHENFVLDCPNFTSSLLSFQVIEPDDRDVYQIGFMCNYYDSLSWTEFCGPLTTVFCLRKNYINVTSFAYDITSGKIVDPITEKQFDFQSMI